MILFNFVDFLCGLGGYFTKTILPHLQELLQDELLLV